MSWSLTQMTFRGFYINEVQLGKPVLLIAVIAALTLIMWLTSYNLRTRIIGIAALVLIAAGGVIYVLITGNMELATTDDYNNPFQFYLIIFIVSVAVWLLSLTRRGTVFLFIAGVLEAAVIQFLYHNNTWLWLAAFLICCAVMFILRGYYSSILSSSTHKTSFFITFIVAIVCISILIGAAAGIYAGVVKTINPSAQTLILYDREKLMELADRTGLTQVVAILDPMIKGEKTVGSSSEGTARDPDGDGTQDQSEPPEEGGGQKDDFDLLARDPDINPISYDLKEKHIWPYFAAIAALVVILIAAKLIHRKLSFERLKKLPRREQMQQIYNFALKKFRQLKQGKLSYETPYEFAERQHDQLAVFTADGAALNSVTDAFVRSNYGDEDIPDADYSRCLNWRRKLYRNLFKYLGVFRYALRFFTL